jgi:hypothetical protein
MLPVFLQGFYCSESAPFFGFIGVASALVFASPHSPHTQHSVGRPSSLVLSVSPAIFLQPRRHPLLPPLVFLVSLACDESTATIDVIPLHVRLVLGIVV